MGTVTMRPMGNRGSNSSTGMGMPTTFEWAMIGLLGFLILALVMIAFMEMPSRGATTVEAVTKRSKREVKAAAAVAAGGGANPNP